MMNRRSTTLVAILLAAIFTTFLHSCQEDGLTPIANAIVLSPKLSDYSIYEGNPMHLLPAEGYNQFDLASELFTDHAEKQRLIKIPQGTAIHSNGDGLPDFPDGTILVKTFFYYRDKRNPSSGKMIIETRLEIKSVSGWSIGTYYWNEEQTDASLITTGMNKTVNWINEQGAPRVISYHIPSSRECSTCHHNSGKIIPIGPKLRNLNTEVVRHEQTLNQLHYLYTLGVLDSDIDAGAITKLPAWKDQSYSIGQRARAYLDVNCAHCHSDNGSAGDTNLTLNFEDAFNKTRIENHKRSIVNRMENGTMPRIGTTVVHDEGLDLIRDYINSL